MSPRSTQSDPQNSAHPEMEEKMAEENALQKDRNVAEVGADDRQQAHKDLHQTKSPAPGAKD